MKEQILEQLITCKISQQVLPGPPLICAGGGVRSLKNNQGVWRRQHLTRLLSYSGP